jgi:hypothetical protein
MDGERWELVDDFEGYAKGQVLPAAQVPRYLRAYPYMIRRAGTGEAPTDAERYAARRATGVPSRPSSPVETGDYGSVQTGTVWTPSAPAGRTNIDDTETETAPAGEAPEPQDDDERHMTPGAALL